MRDRPTPHAAFLMFLSIAMFVSGSFAIYWFSIHGWPHWGERRLVRLQAAVFLAIPLAVLFAIIAFFYRDNDKF